MLCLDFFQPVVETCVQSFTNAPVLLAFYELECVIASTVQMMELLEKRSTLETTEMKDPCPFVKSKSQLTQASFQSIFFGSIVKWTNFITRANLTSIALGGICSEPPGIANGRVSVLGGTQQQLKYYCNSGYLLWGHSELVCLANNT